ncbi:hypothetical protein SAMN05444274_10927 [Mariniphaga anaerophila]|uniref:Uncharacterized protein n=1 Tax=Mariniphaga anaerophila TaxID=1484053 RepID=A0A1M5EGG9_9BACT|nr:hypothetical protein [Mariniphaga anaerophila]SHF78335.1 hypothetical protein SAMN05444274_10927 [Mariniphaga anaerophila]
MKKLFNIFLVGLAVVMTACTADPFEDLKGTGWQKERNILSVLLEGQIGTAVIERTADKATINVYAKEENIADITKVEIKGIELSYGASSQNTVGSTLDFSDGTATISVVSGAGETLDWEVTLTPFVSDLEGTWYIKNIGLYCNMFTWESWGWEEYVNVPDLLPSAFAEMDNILTFVVEGADEKGNPFGNYIHAVGPDGAYSDFTDAANGWDFNTRFRKIPVGEGTWLRDFDRNKVVITDANGKVTELDLELNAETKEVTLKAEIPYLSSEFSWTDTDWNYEKLAHMSNPMWYTLTKEREIQTGNSIVSLGVASQVGDAAIDAENKEISVVVENNGADVSAIEITELTTSYMATADKTVGETLNFSNNNTAEIVVTSESGEAVTWTIKLQIDFAADDVSIAGTWTVGQIGVYCDLFSWEDWGWDKSETLTNYLPQASAELDNTITFSVDGKNEQDQPYGTFENNAGADGEYAGFVSDDTSWPETDFNSRYRKVPTGKGTWVLDGETVKITDEGGVEYILTLEVKSETEVSLVSELEFLSDSFDWDAQNYSYEEVAHMSKKMWYNLNKQ